MSGPATKRFPNEVEGPGGFHFAAGLRGRGRRASRAWRGGGERRRPLAGTSNGQPMKDFSFVSSSRWLAATVWLLAVSAWRLSGDSYPVFSGKIEVEVMLHWSPNSPVATWFTTTEQVVQGGDYLQVAPITGRSPVAGNYIYPPSCPAGLELPGNYPFANHLPLQSSGSPSYPNGNAPVKGAHFTMSAATGNPALIQLSYIWQRVPHWVGYRLDLAGGRKHLVLESFRTPGLYPFNENTGLPSDVHSFTKEVGALEVKLWCDAAHSRLATATPGDNPYITATWLAPGNQPDGCMLPYFGLQTGLPTTIPGQSGTIHAMVSAQDPAHLNPKVVDETFLVQADQTYQVVIRFSTGSADGPINGVAMGTSGAVVSGQITPVDCVVPDPTFCDLGERRCKAAWGQLAMMGNNVGWGPNGPANIYLPGLPPVALIFDGNINSRVGYLDRWDGGSGYIPAGGSLPPPPAYAYTTADPPGHYPFNVPFPPTPPAGTVAFPAEYEFWTILPGTYTPQARVYFQPNHFPALTHPHRFEYFASPIGAARYFDCPGNLDFQDLLVMAPGYVHGTIHLVGPDCGTGTTCLQWIKAGDDLTPATAGSFWKYGVGGEHTSYVSAGSGASSPSGPGGGEAYSAILTTAATPTVWDGNYEFWLAGLHNGESSSWQSGNLTLLLKDPSNPALPAGTLSIQDRLAAHQPHQTQYPDAPLVITPGLESVNDLDYCLTEVTLTFENAGGHLLADPQVAITGGYVGTDHSGQQVNYAVEANFSGTPISPTYTTGNDPTIRFCLPQGTYTVTPSVGYQHTDSQGRVFTGRTQFPVFSLSLGCQECTGISVGEHGVGPKIALPNPPPCTPTNDYVLQGTIVPAADRWLTSVTYTRNGALGPTSPLCTGAACGSSSSAPGLPFTLNHHIPLEPCQNEIILTATDNQGGQTFKTLEIVAPLVIAHCPDDLTLLASAPECSVLIPDLTSGLTAPASCYPIGVVQDPLPGGTWGLGVHPVIFTACDRCGNCVKCTNHVTVHSLISMDCPPDLIVDCQDDDGAIFNYTCPTATSLCCPGPVQVTCWRPSGDHFPSGTSVVTCTAVDLCGNTKVCTFKVTVVVHGPAKWTWARQGGNGGEPAVGHSVAVDRAGNVFVTGSYAGPLSFPLSVGVVTPSFAGGTDVFLAKYNAAGDLQWVVGAGGVGEDVGYGVAVDDAGNAYLTGKFTRTADFESYPHVPFIPLGGPLISAGGTDLFVAKYDPAGACLWVTRAGDTGNDRGAGLAVTPDGSAVFVTGDWGVAGTVEAFVLKLQGADGVPALPVTLSGPSVSNRLARGRGIALDASGQAYVAGYYGGTTDPTTFPGSALPLPVTGGAGRVFVAKFDASTLACLWTAHSGHTGASGAHDGMGIALDPTGPACYATAYFTGAADFGTGQSLVTRNSPMNDYLIVKLDTATGLPAWALAGGTLPADDAETRGITVDAEGNPCVTGFLQPLASSSGVNDGPTVLVRSYDPVTRTLRWTRNATDTAGLLTGPHDVGLGLTVGPAGCIQVTGAFTLATTFPPVATLHPIGSEMSDLFVAQMCPTCCPLHPVLSFRVLQDGRLELSWAGHCCHLQGTLALAEEGTVWTDLSSPSPVTLQMFNDPFHFFRLICP